MNIEELAAKITTMENKIRTLEDKEEIKKLQRAYGFYLAHGMADQLVDLFYDGPDAELMIAQGDFKGKESVTRFFTKLNTQNNPELLHEVMQLSGIVDIASDSNTAQGRWFGFGVLVLPFEKGVFSGWTSGVYENEYVKENGKWKFKKIRWCPYFAFPFSGLVEPSRQVKELGKYRPDSKFTPDGPPENTTYPSGFICPFHFKNPVSGR
jgi:hypothetical protein